jgi:N6-L-threonylcarbamoyladenine synthase
MLTPCHARTIPNDRDTFHAVKAILGVDTSCDDTGVGIVDVADGSVVTNVVHAQTHVHAAFGGVVPERASREHLEVIDTVAQEAIDRAGISARDVVRVAATRGPGLVGALLVGLTWAKAFAWGLRVPFTSVHHLEGHVASAAMQLRRPHVVLIASGGHSHLFYVDETGGRRALGQTRDDAAGEAFDKVARALGLPFPGGPALADLAQQGDPSAFDFPVALRRQEGYDVSFSGLKTSVATLLERDPTVERADVAASFERAVVEALVGTTSRAASDLGVEDVVIAGGVAANRSLRAAFERSGMRMHVPPPGLSTDNGAMIALAAWARPDAPSDWACDAEPYAPWA